MQMPTEITSELNASPKDQQLKDFLGLQSTILADSYCSQL